MAEKVKKARVWAFLMYPDSRPEDWLIKLRSTYLPIIISPCHDKDIKDINTGELDKAHFHVMCIFPNTTTGTLANDISKMVNGTIAIPVISAWGMYQYLDHELVSDKVLYDKKDIQFLNGANESYIKALTIEEEKRLRKELRQYIKKNKILDWCDFIDSLDEYDDDLVWYAENHVLIFKTYIQSFKDKELKKLEKKKKGN